MQAAEEKKSEKTTKEESLAMQAVDQESGRVKKQTKKNLTPKSTTPVYNAESDKKYKAYMKEVDK